MTNPTMVPGQGAPTLTMDWVVARTVVVPLNRPVVSKVGTYQEWPLILIDLLLAPGRKVAGEGFGRRGAPRVVGHAVQPRAVVTRTRAHVENLPTDLRGARRAPEQLGGRLVEPGAR